MRTGVGTLAFIMCLTFSFNAQAAPDLEELYLSIDDIDYEVRLEPSALAAHTKIVTDQQATEMQLDIHLYRGTVLDISNSWISATYYDDTWSGMASLHGKLYEISGANFGTRMTSEGMVNTTSMLSTELSLTGDFDIKTMCATPHMHIDTPMGGALAQITPNGSGQISNTALSVGGVNSVANVVLALDHFHLNLHGGEQASVARAMQILNNVDTMYRNSLGIALNNVAIQTYADAAQFPINQPDTLNAQDLLTEIYNFQANVFGNNDRTLGALLTGRNIEVPGVGAGVAGIAPLDATCVIQNGLNLAVSVNEDRGGLGVVSVILAHEMGHNFGSCHDGDAADAFCPISSQGCPANGPFIMAPFVNVAATEFSQCSIDNINGHLLGKTCLKQAIDISLAAAGNPPANNLAEQQVITRNINVVNNGLASVSNVQIDGNIDDVQIARFNNVTVNGAACTIIAAGKNYQCNIASLPANSQQTVVETIQAVGLGTFNFTSAFNNLLMAQRIDIETSNQQVSDARTVNQAVAAPNAPSGLTASAQSNGNIALTWTDNSNNEQNFQVQRSSNGGGFATIMSLAANSTSYDDDASNLTIGTAYTYQVLAVNAIGSVPSNQSTATALEPTVAASSSSSDDGGGGGGGILYYLVAILFAAKLIKRIY
ncbi:MAG: M12 family metallo-peptidase [Pseudomonadota bacterium]